MASPTVIAHRGASAAHPPGNTIEAFRAAGPHGATWVELDVRRCADGTLAVHHDAELPDGRAIIDLVRGDLPAWVPTLDAALDACGGLDDPPVGGSSDEAASRRQGAAWPTSHSSQQPFTNPLNRLGVNIEIKNNPGDPDFDETEALAGAVVDLLRERQGQDRVLVSSFHLRTIDRVRTLDPTVPTAFLLVHWAAPPDDTLRLCAARGHAAVHPWRGLVSDEVVQLARDLGMAVNVWTVDDPDEMAALAELGVDGIVTNVPDVAAAVLGG